MKKFPGIFFLILMIFVFAADNSPAKNFTDLPAKHWAQSEINALAGDAVVVGYPDGTFRPDQPVTKAEFVTMVIKALWQENYEHEQIYYYKDVPQDHWAYEMIQIATGFDLLKGYPEGYFKPDENLKKAEAVAIVISAVDANSVTEEMKKKFLNIYSSEPQKLISRAEMAVMLFNMRKQALLHPNRKLVQVFTPKKADGIVLEDAEMESNGFIAVIPAGTVLEGILLDKAVNSQKALPKELCVVQTLDNYVTKEKNLLIPAKSNITGEIVNIKKARYFIRNANFDIDAKRVIIREGHPGEINASMFWPKANQNWFSRIFRAVFKGKKLILVKGNSVFVKLTEPLRVDTAKTMIINPLP